MFDRVLPKEIIKDTSGMLSYMGIINTMVYLHEGLAVIFTGSTLRTAEKVLKNA